VNNSTGAVNKGSALGSRFGHFALKVLENLFHFSSSGKSFKTDLVLERF